MLSSLLLIWVFAACGTLAVGPYAVLDYTTYKGVPNANGVTSWKGMRYAAPPLGALRFKAPQPPTYNNTKTVQDASQVCGLPCSLAHR